MKSFFGKFRGLVGQNYHKIGFKARSLLKNISDINRLMWLLINQEPVSFLTFISELRLNSAEEQFSIFSFCDDETMKVIDRIHKLAKDRVYSVTMKQLKPSTEVLYPELKGAFLA